MIDRVADWAIENLKRYVELHGELPLNSFGHAELPWLSPIEDEIRNTYLLEDAREVREELLRLIDEKIDHEFFMRFDEHETNNPRSKSLRAERTVLGGGASDWREQIRASRAELRGEIKNLRSIIENLPPPNSMIGHNQPPNRIEDIPLGEADHSAILEAVEDLDNEASSDAPDVTNITRSIETLRAASKKVGVWLAKKADLAVDETIKSTIKAATIGGAIYIALRDQIANVADVVGRWLTLLSAPF